MKKLASGVVMKGEGTPFIETNEEEKNIINNNKKLDELPFEIETNGGMILTTKLKEEIQIPIEKDNSNGLKIIYASVSNARDDTDENKSISNIVPGKNIKKYITTKNNAKVDVENVIIYGNDIWDDVIELRGNNSSIKINTNNFNYMYFEVAEENHVDDFINDEGVFLDIYIDNDLYETLDEFAMDMPQIEEIEDLDAKIVELKVKITGKNKNRKIYIRNGRLKMVRERAD